METEAENEHLPIRSFLHKSRPGRLSVAKMDKKVICTRADIVHIHKIISNKYSKFWGKLKLNVYFNRTKSCYWHFIQKQKQQTLQLV